MHIKENEMNNGGINTEYNYLINDEIRNFPPDFCIDKRIDPDSVSKKLYDDILVTFFPENQLAVNFEQQFPNKPKFYTIKIDNILLSSDYIGPSVYWARKRGVSDDKIRDFLKQCRTIGGHIVWERGRDLEYKVNTSRGGSDGVYDRFDWTLLLLKIFLSDVKQDLNSFVGKANKYIPEKYRDTNNTNTKFKNLYFAFDCSKWLKNYTFDKFCERFKLYGSFVDKQNNVIETAPLFPFLPTDYEQYIDSVCKAINKRNSHISKLD